MPGAWRITADGQARLFPEDTWYVRVDDRGVVAQHLQRDDDYFFRWVSLENIEYSEFGWPG